MARHETPLTELTHIDLVDESFLYAENGRWFQSFEPGINGGCDLGPVGEETEPSELCVRLNCSQPIEAIETSHV